MLCGESDKYLVVSSCLCDDDDDDDDVVVVLTDYLNRMVLVRFVSNRVSFNGAFYHRRFFKRDRLLRVRKHSSRISRETIHNEREEGKKNRSRVFSIHPTHIKSNRSRTEPD